MEKNFYGDEQWFDKDKKYPEILPFVALVLLVPISMRLYILNLSDLVYKYWNGQQVYADMFSYSKMIITMVLSLFILISFVYIYGKKNFKLEGNKKYYKFIGIYSIMVIISTIFSDYKEITLSGFVGKNENIFILLIYMLILFAAIEMINNEKQIKYIVWAMAIGAVIVGGIGLTQIFNNDLWSSNFGQSLLIPSKYSELLGKFTVSMEKGTAYGTLNNTNYMGSYAVLIVPMIVALICVTKNIFGKVILFSISVLMIINLFGSNSRAGLVGLLLAIAMLFVVLGKELIKKYKKISISVLVIFIALAGVSYVVLPNNINPIKRLVNDFSSTNVNNEFLKDITVTENTAQIITENSILNLTVNDSYVVFTDEDGEEIPTYINDENMTVLNDERYKNFTAQYNRTVQNELVLRINISNVKYAVDKNVDLFFHMTNDVLYISDNKANDYESINVESIGFEGRETLGSGRGYIWSRTLPLILKSPLVGYGADTFAAVFPQNDLKGKLITYGDANQLVDKPHNYYLEIATNTGLISLVAILGIFITYIIGCFKTYKNINLKNNDYILSLGAFISVIGYLGAAFFNDSVIAVAPVFWLILGMGIALNWKIEKEKV